MSDTKICKKCLKDLPFSEFYPHKTSKDRLTYACASCEIKSVKKWNEKNKAKRKLYMSQYCEENWEILRIKWKEKNLQKLYNFSYEEYTKLLVEQDNKCAICQYESKPTDKFTLCVDHDHETGKVRGLLCNNCNRSLGLLKDNIIVLNNAIKYLEKNNG